MRELTSYLFAVNEINDANRVTLTCFKLRVPELPQSHVSISAIHSIKLSSTSADGETWQRLRDLTEQYRIHSEYSCSFEPTQNGWQSTPLSN